MRISAVFVLLAACSEATIRPGGITSGSAKAGEEKISESSPDGQAIETTTTSSTDSTLSSADSSIISTDSILNSTDATLDSKPSTLASESELATPPSQLNGTYLHCATIFAATNEIPTTMVGCRLDDAAGQRIDPGTQGLTATFAVVPISIAGMTSVVSLQQNTSRIYELIAEFTASNKNDSLRAAKESQVAVDLRNINSGTLKGSLSGRMGAISVNLERGRFERYSTDDETVLYFIDTANGNWVWVPDSQTLFTLSEAKTYCDNLSVFGKTQFRLPTAAETQFARLDGLARDYGGANDMNIQSSNYWTSTVSGSGVIGANLTTGAVTTVAATQNLPVACIGLDKE